MPKPPTFSELEKVKDEDRVGSTNKREVSSTAFACLKLQSSQVKSTRYMIK